MLRQKLKEKKLRAPVLPAATKWGSLLAWLDTVLAAESILFSMVSARKFLQAKNKSQRQKRKMVYTLVTGSDLISMLKKGTSLLRVVANQLAKYEKDNTPISEVYKTFLDLPKEFDATFLTPRELKIMKDIVDERFGFVCGDAYGLAYLLDPRFCGEGMDVATRTSVESFRSTWFGEDQADRVLLQLSAFH
ncbi:hypothetical protein PF011_g365 [Phytophthora fragariae]|uniref:Uncharacterized protein n=1 Tax=Phytophthora fragariae TaxID=53985 RepID=A0A6A3MQ68_9STRA|nr:hypothetical protein PF011_g365 [Phytophthora fragariae]